MYGKHFASMYEGSMVGAGCHVFAVWGYVISKGHYTSETIELNPKLLAFILGSKEDEVINAIEFLASPDINSRTKEHEGKRLIKQGEFLYYVPNLKRYRDTFDEDNRREYMKEYMSEYRKQRKTNVNTVKLKLTQGEGEGEVEGYHKEQVGLKTTKNRSLPTEEEFLASLKASPAYSHVNVPAELSKMDLWLLSHPGRKKTRKFVMNWLNRVEAPLSINGSKPEINNSWGKLAEQQKAQWAKEKQHET